VTIPLLTSPTEVSTPVSQRTIFIPIYRKRGEKKREEMNSQYGCTTETPNGRHGLLHLPDAANAAAVHLNLEPEAPGRLLWMEEPNPSVTPGDVEKRISRGTRRWRSPSLPPW
jgi:hypothetical protein